jgi:hypothetical protein
LVKGFENGNDYRRDVPEGRDAQRYCDYTWLVAKTRRAESSSPETFKNLYYDWSNVIDQIVN